MMAKASSPNDAAREATVRVRAYIASLPPETRRALQNLRRAIRFAAPGAVEAFSYGIPAFRLNGKPLVWYAGWKQHVSMYPMGTALRRTHGNDLEGYETSKGTIRFPLTNLPSAALVKRLVKTRAAELRKKKKV